MLMFWAEAPQCMPRPTLTHLVLRDFTYLKEYRSYNYKLLIWTIWSQSWTIANASRRMRADDDGSERNLGDLEEENINASKKDEGTKSSFMVNTYVVTSKFSTILDTLLERTNYVSILDPVWTVPKWRSTRDKIWYGWKPCQLETCQNCQFSHLGVVNISTVGVAKKQTK